MGGTERESLSMRKIIVSNMLINIFATISLGIYGL